MNALLAGFNVYMAKPFGPAELLEILATLLRAPRA
jgi:DNA-binding response OmpR family regulator